MKLYLSDTHSDEEGTILGEGKLGILFSSKEDLKKLCDFFESVKKELSKKIISTCISETHSKNGVLKII